MRRPSKDLVVLLGLTAWLGSCGGSLQTQGETVAVGARAPYFALADFENRPVTLNALTREGSTVIVFYRGAW